MESGEDCLKENGVALGHKAFDINWHPKPRKATRREVEQDVKKLMEDWREDLKFWTT